MYILACDASWEIPSGNLCQLNKETNKQKKKQPQTKKSLCVSVWSDILTLSWISAQLSNWLAQVT